ALVDGGLREDQALEVAGLDEREAARRLRLQPDTERAAGQRVDRQRPRGRPLAAHRLEAVAIDLVRLGLALEQEHDARRLLALLREHHARLRLARVRDGKPLLELVVVEVVEEVDRPQVGERDRGRRHVSTRYSWMSDTAIEPSPTALATRLIDRARTSPATKTPGTVVSRRYGSRFSGQPAAFASGPARMKPRSSRASTPSSQSVRGEAPMKTKHASASSVDSAPSASRTRRAR